MTRLALLTAALLACLGCADKHAKVWHVRGGQNTCLCTMGCGCKDGHGVEVFKSEIPAWAECQCGKARGVPVVDDESQADAIEHAERLDPLLVVRCPLTSCGAQSYWEDWHRDKLCCPHCRRLGNTPPLVSDKDTLRPNRPLLIDSEWDSLCEAWRLQ